MTEYKKRDTKHRLEFHHVFLTKDAEPLGDGTKVTFVLSSRLDKDNDMWMEAISNDELARNLKKGDNISGEGFLTMQRWGDNNDKISFTVRFARLHFPPSLLGVLHERGSVARTTAAKRPAGRKSAAPDLTEDIPF